METVQSSISHDQINNIDSEQTIVDKISQNDSGLTNFHLSLKEAETVAQREHDKQLERLRQEEEKNELRAKREADRKLNEQRIKSELDQIKFKRELAKCDNQIKLANERSRKIARVYELTIEAPTKIHCDAIRSRGHANVAIIKSQADSESCCLKERGKADVIAKYGPQIAKARAMAIWSRSLVQYYKAMIKDKIAGCVLRLLSNRLQVDEDFRFKLHRPIKHFQNHQKEEDEATLTIAEITDE